MNVIAKIREQDIYPDAVMVDPSGFKHREAVRAVVTDETGQVALLNVTKRGFHKLPGGGIESNESRTEALEREVLEEVGCYIEVLSELGEVIEYRDQWQQIQTSFCYRAQRVGDLQQNALTKQEQDHGFKIVWAKNIDEAIAMLEADDPDGYDGKRMKPRDLAILKATKSWLNAARGTRKHEAE